MAGEKGKSEILGTSPRRLIGLTTPKGGCCRSIIKDSLTIKLNLLPKGLEQLIVTNDHAAFLNASGKSWGKCVM